MLRVGFEIPAGAIDGVNILFATAVPYVGDSLVVFCNGTARRADWADGWDELGGVTFRMKEPPKTGDVLSVYYRRY